MNHEGIMIKNWNDTVAEGDTILHLGDLAYRGDRWINHEILSDLPGKKLFVWGNHDKQNAKYYKTAGFTDVSTLLYEYDQKLAARWPRYGFEQRIGNTRVLFSHYPDLALDLSWDINIHGHIHNHGYPIEWDTDKTKKYRNVSVEAINYTPIRLGDLLS